MNNFAPPTNTRPPRRLGNLVKLLVGLLGVLVLGGGLAYGGYWAVTNAEADAAARDAMWEAEGAWDVTPVPAAPTGSGDPNASLPPLGAQALPTVPPPPDVLEVLVPDPALHGR